MDAKLLSIVVENAVIKAFNKIEVKNLDERIDPNVARKLKEVLSKIKRGEKVFFNIVQYQNMGLVKGIDHYYKDATGNKERSHTTWHLTEKGERILSSLING